MAMVAPAQPTDSERERLIHRPSIPTLESEFEIGFWCGADPKQWPPKVVTILQKTTGASSEESCDEVLQILISPKYEFKRNWQKYLEDETRQGTSDEVVAAIYQLMRLAPDVAGMLLDWSLKAKNQTSMSLKGKIKNDPMRTKYVLQREVPQVEREVEHARIEADGNPDFYDPNFYEVTQYNCLLPNILNINMLQAPAKTEATDVFAKKSIQAMISVIWHKQVAWVIIIKMVLCILEVFILLLWGLTTKDAMPFDRVFWNMTHSATDPEWLSTHVGPVAKHPTLLNYIKAWNGQRFAPIEWNILAALNLEQLLEVRNMRNNAKWCSDESDKCTKDL